MLERSEDTIPWRDRISLRTSGRYLLGTAGATTLILGLNVAWREGAATAMLVVGGAMLLLALIGPGVKELRARHGETEIHILREFEQAIIETAAAPNEKELRSRLESLEKQVGEAAALRQSSELREAIIRQLSSPKAVPSRRPAEPIARSIVGPTYAKLTLSRATFGLVTKIVCEVTTPSGRTYEAAATRDGRTLVAANAHAIFPDDFAGAERLEPGPYRVEWKRASTTLAGFAPPETLALDDFVVLPPRPPSTGNG